MPSENQKAAIADSPGKPAQFSPAGHTFINSPQQLAEATGLPATATTAMKQAHGQFPVRVPAAFLDAIQGTPGQQAILRQLLPGPEETAESEGYSADPVGDQGAMAAAGVIHKYQGRVLLIATGACAVHCRYCFRRHFPYNTALASREQWRQAVDYIASRPDISEVILSGGDPLLLDTRRLQQLTRQLVELPHIRRLRVHSRVPVVLPERIDHEFLAWLSGLPWPATLVIHANHPDELTAAARDTLERLAGNPGTTLLNQAVLLAGVNDDPEVLAQLSEEFFDAGVLPYYLHMLDPVQGAAHFEVGEQQARAIMDQLRRRLPGYLVPRLVRETAGAPYKLPLL